MRFTVKLTSRASSPRCVVCHDVLAGSVAVCRGCGSRSHDDCRGSLRRCSTIGCGRRLDDVERITVEAPPVTDEIDLTEPELEEHRELEERRERERVPEVEETPEQESAAFLEGASLPPPRGLGVAAVVGRVALSVAAHALAFAFASSFVLLLGGLALMLLAEGSPLWGLLPLLAFVPVSLHLGRRLVRKVAALRGLARSLRGKKRRVLVTAERAGSRVFAEFKNGEGAIVGRADLGEVVAPWLAEAAGAEVLVLGPWEGGPLVVASTDGTRVHALVD